MAAKFPLTREPSASTATLRARRRLPGLWLGLFAKRGLTSADSRRRKIEAQRHRGRRQKSGQLKKLPARGRKCRRSGKGYSNFSVITGNWSLALARDFTTVASAFSAVVFREVAISLTRRYLARSSIFFSRKERGLLRLRETRLLRTTATSRRDPVRMRSEFSLKRCFQS